jgi:hypothetical protein
VAGYQRKIYLVNPSFQIKFSLFICLILFCASLIYPLTIYELMEGFMASIAKTNPEVAESLGDKRQNLIILLCLWHLGVTGLSFIIGNFWSHRIAGPIYKIQKFLAGIRNNMDYGKLYFRKGDYFKELSEDFNLTFDQIKEDYQNNFVYLSEVESYIRNLSMVVPDDKRVVLEEIVKKLEHMQKNLK